MRDLISFPAGDGEASGYLVAGGGPGVVLIQEWWGLNEHIVDVADRLGDAGFTVLAPDLYHGEVATDPETARRLASSLEPARMEAELSGAVDHLREQSGLDNVGVVGYCLGGGLALWLGTLRPDSVKAVAPYYGLFTRDDVEVDWAALDARVVGEYAGLDDHVTPAAVEEFAEMLRGLGKDVTVTIHEGCQHAFFNDSRPDVYDAEHALEAWNRTLELFRGLDPRQD